MLPVRIHSESAFSIKGVGVHESPCFSDPFYYDFPCRHFILEIRTGGDDLRGDRLPRSELKVTLHLRDGTDVPMHTPLIERLYDWSCWTIEVFTADGFAVRISDIESFSIQAVPMGDGSTWPRHFEDPNSAAVGGTPLNSGEWDFRSALLYAAPIGSWVQVSLPPPVASVREIVPGAFNNDVRMGLTAAERELGFNPAPGWVRLHSAVAQPAKQIVTETARAPAPLGPVLFRGYGLENTDGTPIDHLRMAFFPQSTTEEVVIGEQGSGSLKMLLKRAEIGDELKESDWRFFDSYRPPQSRNTEFRILPGVSFDSDRDGPSDSASYAFGLEAGERPQIAVIRDGAHATIRFKRRAAHPRSARKGLGSLGSSSAKAFRPRQLASTSRARRSPLRQ